MGSLSLLSPKSLALLGLLAPLVLLYVLKSKRRRVRVASTWLWASAQRDLSARSPFQRLVAQLPLLFEALALAALAIGFARPVSRSDEAIGEHVAIVIDVSASMGAAEREGATTTRLDVAKAKAHEIVRALPPGAEVMIVAAGFDAQIASPLERDKRRTEAAIDTLAVLEVEGDLAPAVALATDRLARTTHARVEVLTDGALAHPTTFDGAALPIDVSIVGERVDNVGIARVDVRSGVDPTTKEDEVRAFLSLASSGTRAREVFVTMREDGASDVLASRRVMLEPGKSLPVELRFAPAPGDRGKGLVFDVSPHDALPLDDVAYGRVPTTEKLPVLLVGDVESPWLERALASDPGVSLSRVTGVVDPSREDPGALVVASGACPDDLPLGDLLVVGPPEGTCRGVHVGAIVERPAVTSWSPTDPRLRFVSFDGVTIAKTRKLDVTDPKRVLVGGRDGPLVADASTPGRSVTLVGFDVGESDWPLRASFVLFVRDVIEEARRHRASGLSRPARTGAPLAITVPESTRLAELTRPGARSEPVVARGGLVVVPSVGRAGLYRLALTTPARQILVPVNLASEAESDLARTMPARSGGPVTVRRADAPTPAFVDHAWLLALLALALLVADVVWLTRRPARAGLTASAVPRARRVVLGALFVVTCAPLVLALAEAVASLRDLHVRVARPLVSFVGPLAFAVVAWRRLRAVDRAALARTIGVDVVLGVAVLALGLGAAGAEVGHALDRLTVLLVVDRSRSVDLVPDGEVLERRHADLAKASMRDDDRIGTVVFGATAATEDPPHEKREESPAQRATVGRDATDVEAAIRRALAEVPSDSSARIVLVSDGVATRGDAMAAAMAAVAAEVPVDVLALEQKDVPDVRVVSVRAPARGDEGEAIDLRVVTSAPADTEVEVRVLRDGKLVSTDRTTIRGGEDVLRIRQKLGDGGLHHYEVELSALDASADASAEDNRGSAFVRVRGRAAALVLEGDAGREAFLVKALEDASFRVTAGDTAHVPADLGGFAAYDLVVLGDIPASSLSPGQIEALASYVRDFGGGLWLMGGDRGLGPGGYGKTPIEEVSPVSFDIKQDERRASLAEVIGIDISGSMGMVVGGKTKLELANEAAARSAALLGPGDLLGVEHVDTEVHWSVKLGPVTDAGAIDRAIRSVAVGGGGIIVPITLEAGYAALDHASLGGGKVNLKHMLLFADGDDAEDIKGALAQAKPARSRGITTSVVALGKGHDVSDLEELSRLGGGRFYLIEDASRLPAVFAQETILAARSSLVEKPFRVTPGASSAATNGVDFGAAPELRGYVVTIPKGRASVLLRGPDDDPVLATWPAGIGRAGVFTSDLTDRWGAAWTTWPAAARLVAQTARDLARKAEDQRVRLDADASGGELHLRATVVGDDGRTDSFRKLVARIGTPDGASQEVRLDPIAAGTYAADVPVARQGTFIAALTDEATGEVVATAGADFARGEEMRPTGSDVALLERLASFTGGRRLTTLDRIFDDRRTMRLGFDDMTRALLLLGAIATLASVAARRLSLPDLVGPALARLRGALDARGRKDDRGAATPARTTVAALGERAHRRRRAERGDDEAPRVDDAGAPAARAPSAPPIPLTAKPGDGATRPAAVAPTTTPAPRAEIAEAPRSPAEAAPAPPATDVGGRTREASGPGGAKPTSAEILLAKRRKKPGSSGP